MSVRDNPGNWFRFHLRGEPGWWWRRTHSDGSQRNQAECPHTPVFAGSHDRTDTATPCGVRSMGSVYCCVVVPCPGSARIVRNGTGRISCRAPHGGRPYDSRRMRSRSAQMSVSRGTGCTEPVRAVPRERILYERDRISKASRRLSMKTGYGNPHKGSPDLARVGIPVQLRSSCRAVQPGQQ
jgi:hypothetical protein